jgi:(S)-citramalyl-CoA lyase
LERNAPHNSTALLDEAMRCEPIAIGAELEGAEMANLKAQRSILSLKSWLFTPATKPDRFSRAAAAHADALIIDLEDAVAPAAKRDAREAAVRYLAGITSDHLTCALRINAPDSRFGLEDLEALVNSPAEPDFVIVPKCGSSGTIGLVTNLLREAGKSTQIIGLIETAKGVGALEEIAGGDIRPAALLFGAADMAADLGAETTWEPLLWVRSRLVHATASAGIAALDSPFFDIANKEGLKQEAKASASLGFHGKCAIHPAQIPIINEVLSPTVEEVAKARQILVVNQQGVGSVDGQMVDEAVARKARLVLERAGVGIAL